MKKQPVFFICGAASMLVLTAGTSETNGLDLTILSAWPIQIELSWPSNFTHAVDVYFSTNMTDWEFLLDGEPTEGWSRFMITDPESANYTAGFYAPGDADRDSDGDVLSDDRERYIYKTDPDRPDTDGDTMNDGWELAYGLDPLFAGDGGLDADGDGLSNAEEYQYGTEPDVSDTDGDGINDGEEKFKVDSLATDSFGDGVLMKIPERGFCYVAEPDLGISFLEID